MTEPLHNVLAAVLQATRAPPPAHPGPKPLLFNATYVELAGWLADQVAAEVPRAEQRTFRRLVALARPVREVGQLKKKELDELRSLRTPVDPSPALRVALLLVDEAIQCHRHASCGTPTRHAALAAAEVLGAALVEPLHRELLRLDAVTLLQRQKLTTPAAVAETLWRGMSGVKTTHWLVRLADGTHGLIARTRGRWTFLHGSREDMIASVPDALMASVVGAVHGDVPAAATQAISSVVITPPAAVTAVELSADGSTVYAWCGKRRLAWNAETGEPQSAPPKQPLATGPPPVPGLEWSKDEVMWNGVALELEKGDVTRVVRAGDRVLVAYHRGVRLASFDARGKRLSTIDGRQVGEKIQELIPLSTGLVFAFSPYPRGMVLILDPEARVVGKVRLGVRYVGGHTCFFDGGDRLALAYSHRASGNCLVPGSLSPRGRGSGRGQTNPTDTRSSQPGTATHRR